MKTKTNIQNCKGQCPLRSSALLGGWTLVETVIVLTIIALLAILVFAEYEHQTVELPRAYQAWCKQTGNTKHLTYEEWNDLRKSQPDNNTYVPIIIPISH